MITSRKTPIFTALMIINNRSSRHINILYTTDQSTVLLGRDLFKPPQHRLQNQ